MLQITPTKEFRNKILKFCQPQDVFRKLPLNRLEEYLEIINIPSLQAILKDEDLMLTVKAFFENNLNLSATSKSAFMHRNTLIYRLEKIKREVGLNLKIFEEARIFKNIILINEVLQEKLKEAQNL